jgi:hypothetical protein
LEKKLCKQNLHLGYANISRVEKYVNGLSSTVISVLNQSMFKETTFFSSFASFYDIIKFVQNLNHFLTLGRVRILLSFRHRTLSTKGKQINIIITKNFVHSIDPSLDITSDDLLFIDQSF